MNKSFRYSDTKPDAPALFGKAHSEPDWASTLRNLMTLAKDASRSFDYDKAIDYLCTLEEIWDSKGLPEFSLPLRFELHQEKGKALALQGKLDQAIEEYQKILKFCRDTSHLSYKSETFAQIGQLLCKQGDYDRALGYIQRAIGVYRRIEDKTGMCKALRNLGVIYIELGELEEAEMTYQEAIAVAQEIGDLILYADLVNNLGSIMNMRGDCERALELFHKSLEVYTSQNEIRKSAYTKNNVAITLAEKGMNDEAFTFFREAHEIATQIKDASLTLIVDINLADLYLKRGTPDKAKEHCQRAESYLIESNLTNSHLVEIKKIAGKIACYDSDYDSALESFDEAYDLSRQIGARFLEADVLLERGTLLSTVGRHFDALSDLESSYQIYNNLKAEGKREKTEGIIGSIEVLYLEIFDSMANEVDLKDKYTKGHSDRVASLALLLAKELGLHSGMLKTIVAGALLHDIGKIGVEDNILKKPGKLSESEFAFIKRHSELGVELLRGKEFPWDVKPLILHHHEKFDGRGYPLGLKGEDIPLGARIICVADVFDALTSDRIYRSAFEPQKALEMMAEESGSSFDPVVLRCFTNMINKGAADMVINARTSEKEMYGIWSRCMLEVAPQDTESEEISTVQEQAPA
ncbi:MAG: tetratricopeptide repeat protein [candidate division Zixibacteria bacterium]|nr:tetratricopeptide repeat protein [candidate division Zixibacteria bacterium]MBU1470887.1 tetratricopeptide repeat protein [candidate division Zixibacteria bacterium]MBU2624265.1 tetratricopeptide repeat protein [candidate division Zixibacteria bacterium]